MSLKPIKGQSGFTLLELLIVIVIIGLLALLIIPNLTSAPKKARDVQRKTDLRAVQKGLEEYFVTYSAYPPALSNLTTEVPPIIKVVPVDPSNKGVNVYTYTIASPYSSYTLKACLENSGDMGKYTATDSGCTGSTRSFTLVNNN